MEGFMADGVVVYLVVHELFGILFDGKSITLVTPVVKHSMQHGENQHVFEHKYQIARFKEGAWQPKVDMLQGETYRLQGIRARKAAAASIPSHPEFNPHPPGTFTLNPNHNPFCRWDLPLPKQVHQLRLVSIPESYRPLFTGDPHGDAVETQLSAVSLVHVLEYDEARGAQVAIVDSNGKTVGLDYSPDTATSTINIHLWAELEDESGMDEDMANEHAQNSTAALVDLFNGLVMQGKWSLSVDNLYSTQPRMPAGIRVPEVLTLAEKFAVLGNKPAHGQIDCTVKSCGHGGNFLVDS
jgi:hypothetical protein